MTSITVNKIVRDERSVTILIADLVSASSITPARGLFTVSVAHGAGTSSFRVTGGNTYTGSSADYYNLVGKEINCTVTDYGPNVFEVTINANPYEFVYNGFKGFIPTIQYTWVAPAPENLTITTLRSYFDV